MNNEYKLITRFRDLLAATCVVEREPGGFEVANQDEVGAIAQVLIEALDDLDFTVAKRRIKRLR